MAIDINPELLKNKDTRKEVVQGHNERQKLMLENGFLGKFWGVPASIPYNVTALIVLILILTGIIYTILSIGVDSSKLSITVTGLWGIISPIITLGLGYLFGKGKKQNNIVKK